MLRGSLTDLEVADLVRIPASGGKTGELLIATVERDARLYYVEGDLIHLVLGDLTGRAVLDEILAWTEGEFEFRPDVLTDEATFSGSLETELAEAARSGDDVRELVGSGAPPPDQIRRLLHRFMTEHEFAIHAWLLQNGGAGDVSGSERTQVPAWLAPLRAGIMTMYEAHPRGHLQRMLFEDDQGTVVTVGLSDGSVLLVAAKPGATLGAVSIAVDRLARRADSLVREEGGS